MSGRLRTELEFGCRILVGLQGCGFFLPFVSPVSRFRSGFCQLGVASGEIPAPFTKFVKSAAPAWSVIQRISKANQMP